MSNIVATMSAPQEVESRPNKRAKLSFTPNQGHDTAFPSSPGVSASAGQGTVAQARSDANCSDFFTTSILNKTFNNPTANGFSGATPAADETTHESVSSPQTSASESKAKPFSKSQLLVQAALWDRPGTVKRLISRGTRVNAEESSGFTPLWAAAACGFLTICKILIVHGAKVNVIERKSGFQPLHLAAAAGFLEVVKLLIKHKAEVNGTEEDGATPLWYAADDGHFKVVEALIQAGANVHAAVNSSGHQALHQAASNGHEAIVKYLVQHGANVNAVTLERETPLFIAAEKGSTPIAAFLMKAGADPAISTSNYGLQALHQAAQNGHFNIVQILLESGLVSVNATENDGVTPLWLAAHRGHIKIVEALIEAGCQTSVADKDLEQPLHQAAANGHLEVVKLLLKAKALSDPEDKYGVTPLWLAAQEGHIKIVKALIKAGCRTNVSDKDCGRQPLHQAAEKGHLKVVKSLLHAKALVDPETKEGLTPLWLAAQEGRTDTVKALLAKGADTTKRHSRNHRHAIHEASVAGHVDVVQALLDAGADVNALDSENTTPLILAATFDKRDTLRLLLKEGADPDITTIDHVCALSIASYWGCFGVVDDLLAANASIEIATC